MIISLIDKTDISSLNLTFSPSLDSEMLMVIDGRGAYIGLYECSGEERKGLLRDYRFRNENKDNATSQVVE